jgi:hypothetical protein
MLPFPLSLSFALQELTPPPAPEGQQKLARREFSRVKASSNIVNHCYIALNETGQ